ncbi:MAG: filamentous hemagglutinin N-terminal domain-containing protein [Gammaproteobacteria bacterium]|nr:filamentous hemagglutinin N-terminal domain-containing protein [Gammaproteobacteria bacterium]
MKCFLLIAGLAGCFFTARAEVVLDGSLGREGALDGPGFVVEAAFGRQAGGNLFHSFAAFNLNAEESAVFRGPNAIEQVISRVTGGQPSFIDGLLQSEIPAADFYLINPAGILFGENARVNVPAALYVSAADYLALGENARFDAITPENSTLSIAPPAAFGFLDEQTAGITVQGVITVKPGRRLALSGGELAIQEGALFSLGGEIDLVSVASPGEAPLDADGLAEDAFDKLGSLRIGMSGESDRRIGSVDVTGPGGGKIVIRASNMALNNSYIFADTFGEQNGQGIDIQLRDSLVLKNASRITTDTFDEPAYPGESTGNAGKISVAAKRIRLTDGSQINSNTMALKGGDAGKISISATEELLITGRGVSGTESSAILNATWNQGDAGEIAIAAGNLIMDKAAEIRAETIGYGDAGNISIAVENLSLRNGAQVNIGTGNFEYTHGTGHSGKLFVRAAESVLIDGEGVILREGEETLRRSGMLSNSFTQGDGGAIEIETPVLRIQNRGMLQATTSIGGDAGNIALNTGKLELTQGALLTTFAGGNGKGGTISISAGEVDIRNQSTINSYSKGRGNAGNIIVNTKDFYLREAEITARADASGGGNVEVNAGGFLYFTDSEVTAKAAGLERKDSGGNIQAGSPRFFILRNTPLDASAIGGDGGNINISSGNFLQSNDSILDASSELGIDGKIEIDSPVVDLGEVLVPHADIAELPNLNTDRCESRSMKEFSQFFIHKGKLPPPPYDLKI